MRKPTCAVMILVLVAFLGGAVSAQTRVSDKDIEAMTKNLNEDAKKFVSSFNSGVGKTSIRRTTREKESKELVKAFEQQTALLMKNFKKNKKADAEMRLVLGTAKQVGQLLDEVRFDAATMSAWNKLQELIGLLTKALEIEK